MSDTAVMLCGHGSRDTDATREFQALAAGLKARLPHYDVESGYLEFATPVIQEGLTKLVSRGAKRILALPGMLFAATHVKNDLPWELNSFMTANAGVTVNFGRELGIEPKLLKVAAERIAAAETELSSDIPRAETLLLVVGRGTNDPDANSNISKVARMLWEGMGFGWAETAYSGVAHPRVDAALEMASRLGFRRIVVFPYFLFTGILVKRIYQQTDEVAARHPDIQFVKAGYLNDHPLVLEAFVDRIGEIVAGEARMNCQLCKYRDQVIGYEGEVAARQEGHHHHVRGIGTDDDHGHGHGHHHGHGHAHDHDHRHDHGHGHHHDDHAKDGGHRN